jgi:serine/threonine-protein kinase
MLRQSERVREQIAAELQEATDNDLVVERWLGGGRTGLVFLARQGSLDRQVAVKALLPRYAGDRKAVARFKRESRAMAGCPHPGIVSVYSVGETESGIPFFVMEYVEGETLAQRLARKGKLSLQETARIVTSVSEALTYAHERGLIHRDVKPANVLIERRTGRSLLSDFGVAKSRSGRETTLTLTGTGEIVGSPEYLSPEQAESGVTGARSDQYSLAVMTYEMLTGRLPFEGPDPQDFIRQHVEETPIWLLQVEPSLPLEVSKVVDRGLMKEPETRYSSAEAFGQAFLAASAQARVKSEPERSAARGHELRLLQVAAVYAGVAWGLLEASSWILETFGLPSDLRRTALWIIVAGFPITLGLFWYLSRSSDEESQRSTST